MSEQVVIIEETVDTVVTNATENARKFVNAGLGAVATVRENITKFYEDAGTQTNELAEKGQVVVNKRREAFNEFVEPVQERVTNFQNELETRFNKTTENMLARLNIPTAASIDELNKKIATLSRKVDKIAKAQS
jgi:poly(hydroxyalkanoate) granule-associated protein